MSTTQTAPKSVMTVTDEYGHDHEIYGDDFVADFLGFVMEQMVLQGMADETAFAAPESLH